jgi:ferritin-like protein
MAGENGAVTAPDVKKNGVSRRAFLATGVAAGIGAGLAPLGASVNAFASEGGRLNEGDESILRLLAAAELLEADLWQQYNELGGIQDKEEPAGSGSTPYREALQVLDEDMPQYIHDNTDDEFSHAAFLNAYLESRGGTPVNLDKFRHLPSSKAPGAEQIGRLTNLMELTTDTSWWTRYRSSTKNPDLGDTFAPAVPGLLKGKFTAIPRNSEDEKPGKHLQAIANTAGFHFCTIEQGGATLYPGLAQRVTDPEVLRVLLSIGPTEAMHFQTWHDKAGNAPALVDPTNGLEFPDLNEPPTEEFKTNLIMPEPTVFLRKTLPAVSIIRPTNTQGAAAVDFVEFFVNEGLFKGQPPEFFTLLNGLAAEAEQARRRP